MSFYSDKYKLMFFFKKIKIVDNIENKIVPCLHGILNPVHRHFQNICLMFLQIPMEKERKKIFLKSRYMHSNLLSLKQSILII